MEDLDCDVELIGRELRKAGLDHEIRRVETKAQFLAALEEFHPAIILADYTLPQFSALEAFKLLREIHCQVPVIVVTGSHSEEVAVECMKEGAEDYILKSSLTRLPRALQNALRKTEAERHNKAAELALQQSEAQYRLITENTRDLICLLDAQNRFLYASPSYELVLGCRPMDLTGRDYFQLIHPEDAPAVRTALEQARRQRRQHTVEGRHRHQNGGWLCFESAASLPAETEDQPRRVVMVSRDIGDRKRAEKEIEHLAAFPRFNPNPVLEFSADGSLNYCNDAALLMAQVFGSADPVDILPAEAAELIRQCLATALRQGAETQVSGRTIAWTFYPIHPARLVHCYAEDITERVDLGTQLRRSQKMESIGQLAAGIAHDFNNMLTVIQGHTSLLRQQTQLNQDAQESLEQIAAAAARAANLTRQLLLFSRKKLAQPERLDLNIVIKNVAGMLGVLLGETIAVELRLAPDLPPVQADGGLLEQALMNLAVNARDAMPVGGRITIATAERTMDESGAARLREARAGCFVAIRFSDTGTGMTPEILAHIFEPFFTTKDVGKGTGLGLATVFGIIRQHQGWIEVETNPDAGTTFTILLPALRRSREAVTPPASREEWARGTETVLLVEDEEPLRELGLEVLRHAGYTVFAAANGVEALQLWREHRPEIDLLLTDNMMPGGILGREVAQKIREDEPGLPVLFTSGDLLPSSDGAGPATAHSFLQKPYTPAALAQAVRRCLDRQLDAPPPKLN